MSSQAVLLAMMAVPLLIWAGVFAFVWSVDRRVRELERRLAERREATPVATVIARAGEPGREKERVSP